MAVEANGATEGDVFPDPKDVDWEAVYESMGHDPHEPWGMSSLLFATAHTLDAVADEDQAGDLVGDALDAGILERTQGGPRLSRDDDAPAVKSEPTADDADDTDDADADPPEADATDSTPADPAEMPRADLEAEVEQLREDVDQLQNTVNNDLALIKGAFRELFGLDRFMGEDLPTYASEFRERIDEQAAFVQGVAGDLDVIDDLEGTNSSTTKIAKLRQYTVEQAHDSEGVDYKEAKGVLEVSASYASNLISEAAEHPWFYTEKPGDRTQLRAHVEKIPQGHVFRGENGGES